MEKLCLFCEHFYIDFGKPSHLEHTPGREPLCECFRGHWHIDLVQCDFNLEEYRENMLHAKTCEDFESIE